ncbi:hypothetical protein H2684_09650 [Clostridium sp. cel8]|uniref:hypothetical protein n=1 Tax=Clostridium sp. cel8 TaxID=2663123 RepID=UPI0015F45440|nr:hypothetical protein [Clostridium sp. cel8]MBA5851567.1 hypothetical protein [Clostridium sp. cel8]
MIELNEKIVVSILVACLLTSILSFVLNGEFNGLACGAIIYILFFDKSKITVYDYVFAISLVIGLLINLICIFYKNSYVVNFWSIVICSVEFLAYLKK